MFCFPHTTLSCPSLSSKNTTTQTTKTTFLFPKSVVQGCPSLSSKKNHDNIDNKDNISILFQKCCPKLTLVVVKKTRQHKQQRQHFFLIPKVLSKVVPRCRQKNTTTQTTKTTFLSYSKKCCPKLSLVVVKKITTTQTTKTTFLSYSKNVVQSCPSLSSKKSSFHENIYLCLRKY